jgi:predicted RNA methylase
MRLDQHFTSKTVAVELVRSLVHRLDPTCSRRYIEPACGAGSFVEALEAVGIPRQHTRTVEIDHELPADVHQDFLETTRTSLGIDDWRRETTVVVGNPPFGRNGRLARQFLTKAAEYANWVCFIVPRSMHGANGCCGIEPRLELIHERRIDGSFDTTRTKCNWQEWIVLPEGQKGHRPIENGVDTRGLYELVPKYDRHDLVIQRCGMSAGRVTTCNGTGEGKYYIRSRYHEVLDAFRSLPRHEEASLTAHQDSLSMRMLHELLERALLNQFISRIKGSQ